MIPKINQDLESARHQKNMTDTQKRNDTYIKEGIIVNSYVKDPLLEGPKASILDETCDTLVVYEKEAKKTNPLLPLCCATIGVMGLLGGFTAMMKKFSKGKLESSKEYLLPGITRNHCINDEIHQSIFSMIQSPNRKTILASLGVITLGSMAFMGKIFIDGFKEVWVKKQEADIQKNLQENLIAIETQSFSGKIQIIRSMLSSKAKIFSNELAFRGKRNENNKIQTDSKGLLLLGSLTLLSILSLGYYTAKNIRKSNEFITRGLKNTRKGLDNIIEDFNNGKSIGNIQGHNGETSQDVLKTFIDQAKDWEWTEENLHEKLEAFRAFYKEKGVKPKITMWAIRAAVTGRICGADMTAILAIIGKDKTFNRVNSAIKQAV